MRKLIVLMFVLISNTIFAKFDISQRQIDSINRAIDEQRRIREYFEAEVRLNAARQNTDGNIWYDFITSTRIASIADVHPYYREACFKGNWNLFNLPKDMATRAYQEQRDDIDDGFWSTAFRTMFYPKSPIANLGYYIPDRNAKRTIIYLNPANPNSGSAYWAQQLANYGYIIVILLGISLVAFAIRVAYKIINKRKIEIEEELTIDFGQTNFSIEAKMSIYKLLTRMAKCDEEVSLKASEVLLIASQILGLNKNNKIIVKVFIMKVIAIFLIVFGTIGIMGGVIGVMEMAFGLEVEAAVLLIITSLIFGSFTFGGVHILKRQKDKVETENIKSETIESIGKVQDKQSDNELLEYLSDFEWKYKEWFVKAIIFIRESYKRIPQEKINLIEQILLNMGVTKEEYKEIKYRITQNN